MFSVFLLWTISGMFSVAAMVLSTAHIYTHLRMNPHKLIRRSIVRILLMVPIYAITSFFGLVFKDEAEIFSLLRDCYEAFVIYSFFTFLVEYLGGLEHLADTLRSKSQVKHVKPFCCLREWTMGSMFLKYCVVGVLQYVPIKLLMAFTTVICHSFGVYGNGEFKPTVAYPYITFITNCSQIWAMYCLILFYIGVQEELAPIKPIYKILSIKAIVFFTYWQSVLISILGYFDLINDQRIRICSGPNDCWKTKDLPDGLQDFIICIEMLCFALAHLYVFRVEDFVNAGAMSSPDTGVKAPLLSNLMDAINVADVAKDVKNSQNPILTKKQALAARWETSDVKDEEEF